MENVHLTGVGAGDRLKLFDAGEFALIWSLIRKTAPIDDLHGAISAHDISREPDFAVGALTDTAEQFVIGNLRRCGAVQGAFVHSNRLVARARHWWLAVHSKSLSAGLDGSLAESSLRE